MLYLFPGMRLHCDATECQHCSRDKHVPKLYSPAYNMDPGPVPYRSVMLETGRITFVATIAGSDPIGRDAMTLYHLPQGEYGYKWPCCQPAPGHIVICQQSILTSWTAIVRKEEGSNQSHHDCRVRRSVCLVHFSGWRLTTSTTATFTLILMSWLSSHKMETCPVSALSPCVT